MRNLINFSLAINIDGHELIADSPFYKEEDYGDNFIPSLNFCCDRDEINFLSSIEKELLEKNRELYRVLNESYPMFGIRGYYENEKTMAFGTIHKGFTDIDSFKKIFGEEIQKSFYLITPPFLPVPISFGSYWYQTGDLIIPENLKEIVAKVEVNDFPVIGSFGFVPLKISS